VLAIRCFVRALNVDERGATAVEYGLICALIVLAIIGGISSLAEGLSNQFNYIDSKI